MDLCNTRVEITLSLQPATLEGIMAETLWQRKAARINVVRSGFMRRV